VCVCMCVCVCEQIDTVQKPSQVHNWASVATSVGVFWPQKDYICCHISQGDKVNYLGFVHNLNSASTWTSEKKVY
jgi:hypothetical protein